MGPDEGEAAGLHTLQACPTGDGLDIDVMPRAHVSGLSLDSQAVQDDARTWAGPGIDLLNNEDSTISHPAVAVGAPRIWRRIASAVVVGSQHE